MTRPRYTPLAAPTYWSFGMCQYENWGLLEHSFMNNVGFGGGTILLRFLFGVEVLCGIL